MSEVIIFFKYLKKIMVELTALSSRIGRANALLNFYVSHGSAKKVFKR